MVRITEEWAALRLSAGEAVAGRVAAVAARCPVIWPVAVARHRVTQAAAVPRWRPATEAR